jgi:hypothetical protein
MPNEVGTAKVGAFNKEVPYQFDEPVSAYLEKSLNKMICTDTASKNFVPVTVIIDTFKVFEKMNFLNESGIFKASINFIYPVTSDSTGFISTYTIQEATSGIDVTDMIENQIYKGTHHCAEQFIKDFGKTKNYKINSESLIQKYTEEKPIPQDIRQQAYNNIFPVIESEAGVGFNYYSGDKIKSGFEANYITFNYKKDDKFQNGFGFGVCVFNIENPIDYDRQYKGNLVAFHGKYIPRYYFMKSSEGLYFEGGLVLTAGSEKISEGESNNTNFFFGPTLSESLGLKLGPLCIGGGLYEIALLGSKMLPSDMGFIINAGIQF